MSLRKYLIDTFCVVTRTLKGVDNKKALFISYNGSSYSDNPKAISEVLHDICPEADIVWAMKDPESKKKIVPEYAFTAEQLNRISVLAAEMGVSLLDGRLLGRLEVHRRGYLCGKIPALH